MHIKHSDISLMCHLNATRNILLVASKTSDCKQLAQVKTFPYLGTLITEDGQCKKEFQARLSRVQTVGAPLQQVWKSHSTLADVTDESSCVAKLCIAVKVGHWERMKKNVWGFWNERIEKDPIILRVPWTAKKRNEWVVNKAWTTRELLDLWRQGS